MKKTMKILAVVLALVLSLSALTACGDTKPADTNETTVTEAAKTQAVKVIDINLTEEQYAFGVDKAQPELLEQVNAVIKEIMADGTFDEICDHYFGDGEPVGVTSAVKDDSKEQLVVATNAAFEPFEFTKGDKYYGIDMEIAQIIAEKTGRELVIDNMDFQSVCLSVGQHKCDIAMAGLSVKPEREEFVTFSDSYYEASQKVIVKGDDTTFDACTDKASVEAILNGFDSTTRIGVQVSTTGELYVKGNGTDYAGFKTEVKSYKNGSLACQDLINGNIDLVVIDSAPAAAITAAINELA
ncbi:MAG TPA: amino acid ABC transporter substrate-binding protein [Ruminococcaceae bacterium]|nr:amino acid ABC transporter substrate-binding protein [Oscillospiraceae bacterium]